MKGERAIARERSRITQLLTPYDFIIVTGGLGCGTATGGIRTLASVAKSLAIPAVFLLTTPFSFESYMKRKNAEDCIGELLPITEALVTLPNDLLFSVLEATTPLAEAFRLADREVSRSVLALTAVLRNGNLLAADFGDFVSLLKRRKSYCSIGVGLSSEADSSVRIDRAMEELLHSPLLGGAGKLGEADAVILSLLGGPELSIGETKAALELASRQVKPEARVIVGAATAEEYRGMLQLCAVTVRLDAESEVAEVMHKSVERTPKRSRAGAVAAEDASQLTLPFLETVSKGIMENTTPVIWNGEDLDIPTFKRRNTVLDNGKTLS